MAHRSHHRSYYRRPVVLLASVGITATLAILLLGGRCHRSLLTSRNGRGFFQAATYFAGRTLFSWPNNSQSQSYSRNTLSAIAVRSSTTKTFANGVNARASRSHVTAPVGKKSFNCCRRAIYSHAQKQFSAACCLCRTDTTSFAKSFLPQSNGIMDVAHTLP